MKVKKVLRFYFSAQSLERAFNNLILSGACGGGLARGAEECAERLCELIWEKQELSRFWGYLNGVMENLSEREREVLGGYAAMRCGLKRLSEERRREIKSAAMKFRRRARRLESFSEALGLVGKYYCLLAPS